jgi:hypothetical protein
MADKRASAPSNPIVVTDDGLNDGKRRGRNSFVRGLVAGDGLGNNEGIGPGLAGCDLRAPTARVVRRPPLYFDGLSRARGPVDAEDCPHRSVSWRGRLNEAPLDRAPRARRTRPPLRRRICRRIMGLGDGVAIVAGAFPW